MQAYTIQAIAEDQIRRYDGIKIEEKRVDPWTPDGLSNGTTINNIKVVQMVQKQVKTI